MEKRPPSDEIPPLDQLASKVPAMPAASSPERNRAAPDEEASTARPRAPTTLDALEVKIDLAPVDPRSEAEVPEDAKTGDYVRVSATDEAKATGLYAPAVSTLIDRLDEPEVAAAVDPNLARLRLQLPHLRAIEDDLKAHLDPEDGLRAGILERAQAAVAETYALLESLPREERKPEAKGEDAEEPEVSELDAAREALLEANLALQRVIASCPAPPAPLPPEPAPARAAPKGKEASKPKLSKALAEEEREGRRRLVALGVIVGLLALGRAAILLQEGQQVAAALEEKSEAGRVQTTNRAAGATAEQLAGGIPSVLEVRLVQLEDGSLRARAAAIDPDGDPLSITYRWLENEQEVEVEGRGIFLRVRPGATYRVEARVSDGKRESEPLRSPALVAGAAGSKP